MPKQSASYDRVEYVKSNPVGMTANFVWELMVDCRERSPCSKAINRRCIKVRYSYGETPLTRKSLLFKRSQAA